MGRIIKNKIAAASIFYFSILFPLLHGCAHSDLSRSSANRIDSAYQSSTALVRNASNSSIVASYQNTSQTTKGVIIGGIAGAAAGSMTSLVGFWPGAAIGIIGGGAIGAYIDRHGSEVDKLRNRAVKVIVIGDQVLIVLPWGNYLMACHPH